MNAIVARFAILPFLLACFIALALPAAYAASVVLVGGAASLAMLAGMLLTHIHARVVAIPLVAFSGFSLVVLSAVPLLWYPERLHSLIGESFDMQSIAALLAGATVFAVGVAVGRARLAPVMFITLEWGGAGFSLWLLGIVFHVFPEASLMTEWESVAFLLIGALSTSALLASSSRGRGRLMHAVLALLSGVGVVILSLPTVTFALVAGATVSVLMAWHLRDARVITLLAAAALIGGLYFVGVRAPLIPVEGNVRPSYSASSYLMAPLYFADTRSVIFGTGIGSYGDVWNMYRTADLNRSARWNETPRVAFSTAITFAVEGGLLLIAAILFLWTLAALGALRNAARGDFTNTFVLGSLLTIFGCAFAIFAIPVPLFLIAMLTAGVAAGTLGASHLMWRAGTLQMRVYGLLALCAALLLIAPALRLGMAAHAETAAVTRANMGNRVTAAELFEYASGLWPTEMRYEEASRSYADLALNGAAENRTTYRARAVQFTRNAVVLAPHSFDAQIQRASFYVALVESGEEDAVASAKDSLQWARAFAPTRPEGPYLSARLNLAQGDTKAAHSALEEALTLKPDYTEAQALLTELDAATSTAGVVQ